MSIFDTTRKLMAGIAYDPSNPPTNADIASVTSLMVDRKGRPVVYLGTTLGADLDSVGIGASIATTGFTHELYAALTNTVVDVKTAASKLYVLDGLNINTGFSYIQAFDDLAANVTLGVTTPTMVFGLVQGVINRTWVIPWTFDVALSIAVTTTPTGSTAPASNVVLNVGYK